jgi:hypothetical protein
MSAFLEMLVRFQIYDELKLLEVDHFVGKYSWGPNIWWKKWLCDLQAVPQKSNTQMKKKKNKKKKNSANKFKFVSDLIGEKC